MLDEGEGGGEILPPEWRCRFEDALVERGATGMLRLLRVGFELEHGGGSKSFMEASTSRSIGPQGSLLTRSADRVHRLPDDSASFKIGGGPSAAEN